MRRFVDVERPTIGREGLQLGDDGDEHQEEGQLEAQSSLAVTLQQVVCGGGQAVDIQRPGGMVGKDDADQQEDRDHLRNDQVLETGGQAAVFLGQQDQPTGGDGRQFEEDEQVEDVASEDDAAQCHSGDQQHRHGAPAVGEQGFLQIDRREQAGQVGEQGQCGFRQGHAQVDDEGWRTAGSNDLDRRSASMTKAHSQSADTAVMKAKAASVIA